MPIVLFNLFVHENFMPISPQQKLNFKRRAHALKPVVILGQHGLTDAVLKAIDEALEVHELIKVKLAGVEREQTDATQVAICEPLRAEAICQIGHMLVIWRKRQPVVAKKAPKKDKKRVKKQVAKLRNAR